MAPCHEVKNGGVFLDNRKIAFIIAQMKDGVSSALKDDLTEVIVPQGYQAELVLVDARERRKAAAWQEAMTASDARYKVYLDEDVRILQKDFLVSILEIFSSDDSIAVIGVSGAKELSTSGIVQESVKRAGMFRQADGTVKKWGTIDGQWQEAAAIDGFFVATQYDLPWREDYQDDVFFITAQSVHFKQKGYKTVVAAQASPWLQAGKLPCSFSKKSQAAFLDEYSVELYPLVTIMIPTYNRPEYFEIALKSALGQTYRNLEIVVSDDSDNDLTERLIQKYLQTDNRIKYFHHKNFTFFDNWEWMYEYNNPKAEYINYLMDDDVFALDKIEKMIYYYLNMEGITLVTSYRQIIDSDGRYLNNDPLLNRWTNEVKRFDGNVIGRFILMNLVNIVGEPTTVLVRKKYLKDNYYGWKKIPIEHVLADYPTWLNLLSQGDVVYIPETLSFFRIHDGQDQANPAALLRSILCWGIMIAYAWEQKVFFQDVKEYKTAVDNLLNLISVFSFPKDKMASCNDLLVELIKQLTLVLKYLFQAESAES